MESSCAVFALGRRLHGAIPAGERFLPGFYAGADPQLYGPEPVEDHPRKPRLCSQCPERTEAVLFHQQFLQPAVYTDQLCLRQGQQLSLNLDQFTQLLEILHAVQ